MNLANVFESRKFLEINKFMIKRRKTFTKYQSLFDKIPCAPCLMKKKVFRMIVF